MNLKSTRQILSVLMTFVIAASLVLIAISSIVGQTVCSKSFYVKHMASNQLVQACNAQLEIKFDALSKKSNIPSDVFNSVMTAYKTDENIKNAVSYLFDENDSTMFNQNMVNFFYDSCVEYLEANEIEYSKTDITNAATEAAQIYSDTVGIHNINGISTYIQNARNNYLRMLSVCMLIVFIFVILMLFLYRESYKALYFVASAFLSAGVADILISILLLLSKIKTDYMLSPIEINEAFSSMTRACERLGLVAGLITVLVGLMLLVMAKKQESIKQQHKDTRFFKIVTKL